MRTTKYTGVFTNGEETKPGVKPGGGLTVRSGGGKTSDALDHMHHVREVMASIQKVHGDVFKKVEDNVQPDKKWLRANRKIAQETAASVVIRDFEQNEHGLDDVKIEGKWRAENASRQTWTDEDKLAILVAEKYREFLEDPKLLESDRAARPR